MRRSLRLGRIAGVEIGAHWSVLVIAVLLGYGLATAVLPSGAPGRSGGAYVLVAIVLSLLFLAGLLGHELAHAVVARRVGVGVRGITLWLLGGVSELDRDSPTPKAELLIAGAGPLTSLVFGGVAAAGAFLAGAAGASRLVVVGLAWLAGVNILLGVFNLLPGAPLDGGRVVRALVWRLRGDRDRAQIAADHAGVAVGILLAALGLLQTLLARNLGGLWLVLLGWFLVSAANAETAAVRVNRALDGRSVRDIMAADPVCGRDDQTIDAFLTDTAARHPHTSYPVVDHQGALVGTVRLQDLARTPATARSARLSAAVTPARGVPVIAPDEPASAAARNLTPAQPLLVVADHEHVVGVVGSRDVSNALTLSQLEQARDTRPPDSDGSPSS